MRLEISFPHAPPIFSFFNNKTIKEITSQKTIQRISSLGILVYILRSPIVPKYIYMNNTFCLKGWLSLSPFYKKEAIKNPKEVTFFFSENWSSLRHRFPSFLSGNKNKELPSKNSFFFFAPYSLCLFHYAVEDKCPCYCPKKYLAELGGGAGCTISLN